MFDSGNSLDHAIDALYDPIVAMQRVAVDLERDYRELAQRNDIATDTLGADTTPGEAIATVTEALAAMRQALDDVETHRATAKRAAARLYIDPDA